MPHLVVVGHNYTKECQTVLRILYVNRVKFAILINLNILYLCSGQEPLSPILYSCIQNILF